VTVFGSKQTAGLIQ